MENKEIQLTSEIDIDQEEIEIIGINSICRFCASQNERLIGVFSEEGVSNDLATKINLYLPVKVAISDELPLQCCWNCASTILAWHELVLTCVESDRKFRTSHFITEKQIIGDVGYDPPGNPASDDNDGSKTTIKTEEDVADDRNPLTSDEDDKKPQFEQIKVEVDQSKPETDEDRPDTDEDSSSTIEETVASPVKDFEDLIDTPEMRKFCDGEDVKPYFTCEYCPKMFTLKRDVIVHVRQAHGEDFDVSFVYRQKKEKRCNLLIDKEELKAAKVKVNGRTYYNCKECGKNLYSSYTYMCHMRIHTGERPHACELCGKRFRVNQGLVRHLRETHQGIREFPCDLCGRNFATRRSAEEHRRIHTNERPHMCDLCGKSFKQKASLFIHRRSHKSSHAYKCSSCDKGFHTQHLLMVHITKHTGEKPFKCDTCNRCFRIKYELKRHQLIHSDEKPWVCNVCGVGFRQKRYMINHQKSNHPEPAPDGSELKRT